MSLLEIITPIVDFFIHDVLKEIPKVLIGSAIAYLFVDNWDSWIKRKLDIFLGRFFSNLKGDIKFLDQLNFKYEIEFTNNGTQFRESRIHSRSSKSKNTFQLKLVNKDKSVSNLFAKMDREKSSLKNQRAIVIEQFDADKLDFPVKTYNLVEQERNGHIVLNGFATFNIDSHMHFSFTVFTKYKHDLDYFLNTDPFLKYYLNNISKN